MSTTITPSLGHGPWTQQGVGATSGYDCIDFRGSTSPGLQEGALSAGSYEVTQRGAGANMSVDVAATTGDGAVVQGDAVSTQGLYVIAPHASVINEAITAAHATLPRIDQVVLEVKDTQHDASGSNLAQVRVVAGTATAGATLTNRTGAAALPASAMLLADVLVGAAAATITNTVIRDRRTWARGAYSRLVRTAGNIVTASASAIQLSSTLQARLECSGVPVKIAISGMWLHSTNGSGGRLIPVVDGAAIDGMSLLIGYPSQEFPASAVNTPLYGQYVFIPAAGSHLIEWYVFTTAASLTVQAVANTPLVVTVEELVRQNTKNNATTTG